MGMFDSVMVTCPSCGEKLEFQSKAGDCNLEIYQEGAVPGEIAGDILQDAERCKCGKYVGVFIEFPKRTVPMLGRIIGKWR